MESWQKERAKVLRRARTIVHTLARAGAVQDQLARDAAAVAKTAPDDIAVLRVFTGLMYEHAIAAEIRTALKVSLVHGLLGMHQHAWLTVEGDPNLVHPDPKKALAIAARLRDADIRPLPGFFAWRYVIDVACPDVESASPGLLLVSPLSPLYVMYQSQSVYDQPIDYTDEIEAGRAILDESLAGQVLKALGDHHADGE